MAQTPITSKLKSFWGAVRETEASLPEFVFLTSIEDPFTGLVGDVVVEATRLSAATCIVNKTHRVATKDEVAKFRREQERIREQDQKSEMGRAARALLEKMTGGGPQSAAPSSDKQ